MEESAEEPCISMMKLTTGGWKNGLAEEITKYCLLSLYDNYRVSRHSSAVKVTVWQVSQGETWREEGSRKGERERTLIIGNDKPQTLYIQSNVYTILFSSPTTYTLSYRL